MSAPTTFEIKRNDRLPYIRDQLVSSEGQPLPIPVGATVTFTMVNALTGSVKISAAAATVVDAARGLVEFAWRAGDTDTAADYLAEWRVTTIGGITQTVPTRSGRAVRVNPPLA